MLRDSLMRKLSALLALAQNKGASQAEAASAMARAKAIAARYDVALETVPVGGIVNNAVINEHFHPGTTSMWRASLGWNIARYAGIQMIRVGGKPVKFSLVGRQADIDLWRTLYARASDEIDSEGKRYSTGRGKSEGDTFRKGAASGFGARLADWKREAEASEQGKINRDALHQTEEQEQSTALVLVGREIAVKNKVAQVHPKLKNVAIERRGSRAAHEDGVRFGRSMGVHRGNLGEE